MSATPQIELIAVGDELVAGRVVDTLSPLFSRELLEAGYVVRRHQTVADAPGALAAALRGSPPEVEAVMVTGGLGPTVDDRTREEFAAARGVPLDEDADLERGLRELFRVRGLRWVGANARQAHLPRGAEAIANSEGTAPGIWWREGASSAEGPLWIALPGVPHESVKMFRRAVLPRLRREIPPRDRSPRDCLRFFNIPEARLDEWLAEQLPPRARDEVHLCVREGEIEVRVEAGLGLAQAARARFGGRFLGEGEATLAERLVRVTTERGLRVATAESCTGGAIAARITAIPGASHTLECGWVSYSDAAKEQLLKVSSRLVREHGAVSGEVAREMVRGALAAGGIDLAVAATGIAGPGGGSEEKPVGTTWLAVADARAGRAGCWSRSFRFRGDRSRVRALACQQAMFALFERSSDRIPHGWEDAAGRP